MSTRRFTWIGFHAEGLPALDALLAEGAPITDVITLRSDIASRRRAGADYRETCARHGVPLHDVTNLNESRGHAVLREAAPDVAFVIGWPQRVQAPTIALATTGMIGAHASLLPDNRGSAPISWALIRGERESGNSLFWLGGEDDRGALLDQVRFPITPYDSCGSLYARVAASNREMLLRVLPRLLDGEGPDQATPLPEGTRLPRRRDADGDVDWAQSTDSVYDFIRALSPPSPGAFSSLGGRRWRVRQAALPRLTPTQVLPGTVIGPVVSPVDEACGQLVACAEGAIVLLELESDDGRILRGRDLSEQPWAGQRWIHG
jgi:methionyl-tRNA formyltransferase